MINYLLVAFISVFFVACSQQKPAQIDYYGNLNYGKNSKSNDKLDKNIIIVKDGDTLISIAKKNSISLKDLKETNNLNINSIIKIGDKLIIPSRKYHEVQSGETLSKIAKSYNIDKYKLAYDNNIKEPFKVKLGQKLIINNVSNPINEKDQQQLHNIKNEDQEQYNPYKPVKVKQLEEPSTKETKSEIPDIQPEQQKEEIKPVVNNKFIWPVKGEIISKFGLADNKTRNDGINISASQGTDVKSAANGVVAYAGNGLKGFGNLIIIKHDDNILTAYAHLEDLLVQKSTKVTRGQLIGHVGLTGDVSVSQLHFAARKDKKPIDPLSILPKL